MSEIKGIQRMDLDRKLAILADAAKYDASCASSGTEMRDSSDRLYQADWLMRFYGFEAGEIVDGSAGMLPLDIDPKLAWALRHRDRFPLDVNRASREELLRVGLRHQGSRPHHRHAPPHLDPCRRPLAVAYPQRQGVAVHRARRSPPLAAS